MVSKVDYYELLGVTHESTSDEIKTAFRKQALIWHPDKNSDRLEEATEKFKSIHEAYSVLSDPHERAWYDSHKSEILTGNKSEEMDLWSYFSHAAYPGGFTDEPTGFYQVYDELFETLNKKENSDAKEKSKIQTRPRFGTSNSNIENLKLFYNYWSNFTTTRLFSWADVYNPAEAPNRKVRRIIELENTKERNKQRKIYNEMVTSLVDFVKKRDPRWIKFCEEAKIEKIKKDEIEEEQRKADEIRQKEMKEIYRKQQAERYAREYEEKLRQQNEEEAENSDQEESLEDEVFWCEVCRKSFSNQGQLNNHNNSKKHKQALQKLKKEVQLPEEIQQKPKNSQEKKKKSAQEEEKKQKVSKKSESESEHDLEESDDDHHLKFLSRKKVQSDSEDSDHKPQKKSNQVKTSAKLNVVKTETKKEEVKREEVKKEEVKKQEVKKEEVKREDYKEEEKKVGKAKLKREKKKAQASNFICRVCKVDYQTKNKLFTHLKESGHEKAV